jgi:hypothetical protein
MCTVSYIPLATGYLLTVNRDEDPKRATLAPQQIRLGGDIKIIAPRDELKGGTWVALDEKGRAACLLNGAFDKHQRQVPYRKSRGHFVFEAMGYPDFGSFIRDCQLHNIEPFTMLMITPGHICKLVWDGSRKYNWQLPHSSKHLWSSPTLYTPKEHAVREKYFKDAMSTKDGKAATVLQIHGSDSATPFILDLPGVRTLSITQISVEQAGATLQYYVKMNSTEKATLISSIAVPYLQGSGATH